MAYYTMAEENNHRFLQLGWMLLFPPQEYFLNSWFSTKTVSMVDYHKTKKDLQAQELEWYKNPWKWKSSAPLSEVCRFCDCSFSTFADEGPQMQNFNLPREYIRNFFPKWKCFVFAHWMVKRDFSLVFLWLSILSEHLFRYWLLCISSSVTCLLTCLSAVWLLILSYVSFPSC